ncbi:MAG: hypothetical protein M1829_000624 [Trizodia sp. TS-e1964]|nr:MAG: hypothetical protein M1829_000624 [Trizodia sp. TS-e1964]
MGRRKIEIKAIKDDRNRSVTFLKRKGGLFKKAHELSVLCSVDVAVIIFGHNKKLYEYSSTNVGDIIGRYQYYGTPHEHKGPADFSGKKDADDDDDDEMASPPPESHSSAEQPLIPPHLQSQPGYQHINMRHQTPSASPPIPNGVPFHHRQHTPQPAGVSRPSSRNAMRRPSSNLVPPHHAPYPSGTQSQPHAPPSHNGFPYGPNPPIYNPQAGAGMPNGPAPNTSQPPPYHFAAHPQQQQHPHQPPPHQLPGPQAAFAAEQQQASMPPASFAQDRTSAPSDVSPPQPRKVEQLQAMPGQRRAPPKSKSIFTPIDVGRSVLAQHWGAGPAPHDSPVPQRREPLIKSELPHNKSPPMQVTSAPPQRKSSAPSQAPASAPHAQQSPELVQRTASVSSSVADMSGSRQNSISQAGAMRPRLKVQIPSEHSDGGSATGDSSPHDSAQTMTGNPQPAKGASGTSDGNHSSGVVLPPPSPSASGLLSAGASGPPNPFARPQAPTSQSFKNDSNNSIETPISALPSRFMADGLLPSPSSFYPDWGFGRGADPNMLPSPLNFQTPVVSNGPSFLREELGEKEKERERERERELERERDRGERVPESTGGAKRKSPEGEISEPKRVKV